MRRNQGKGKTIGGERRSRRIGQEERKKVGEEERKEETTREREDMRSGGGEEVLGE